MQVMGLAYAGQTAENNQPSPLAILKKIKDMPSKAFMPPRQLPGGNAGKRQKLGQGKAAHTTSPAKDNHRQGGASLKAGNPLDHRRDLGSDQIHSTAPGFGFPCLLVKPANFGTLGIIENRYVDRTGDARLGIFCRATRIDQHRASIAQGQYLLKVYLRQHL